MLSNAETAATAERNLAGGVGVQNTLTITSAATQAIAAGNYALAFDSGGETLDSWRYLLGTTQGGSDVVASAVVTFDGTTASAGTATVDADGSFGWVNEVNPGTLSMTAGTYWLRFEYWYGGEAVRTADHEFTLT